MYKIRLATTDDAKACVDIYSQYIDTTVTLECTLPSVEVFAGRIESFSAVYPFIVLEDDNFNIFGYAYAHRYREREAFDWISELSVYLDKDFKSKGAGSLMYQIVMDILVHQNMQSVVAVVVENNPKSVKMHTNLGFVQNGKVIDAGYKNGMWVNSLTMQKIIGERKVPCPKLLTIHEIDKSIVDEILSTATADFNMR